MHNNSYIYTSHASLTDMDTAIDLSDASKALDLANIRFQLMYTPLYPPPPSTTSADMLSAAWKTQSPFT